MKKLAVLVVAVLCLLCVPNLNAQAAPAPLPGYTVQLSAGYSNTQGQSNSGMFTSLAAPIWTRNSVNTMSLSARVDYFTVTTPSTYALTAGPEFRFQFSRANILGGIVFQPFANVGLGAARSQCVSTSTCPVGADTASHLTEKLGGGIDIPVDAHSMLRLFEVDYIHSTIFPGGHITMSNFAQLSAGFGFRF